ncbi:MAG: DUF2840 domain-containing protein [Devosiaceae bacterium]|nr:DUF2840 domain-containing protein [Devosiaceae bacterium]
MNSFLTRVHIYFKRDFLNYYIRFGNAKYKKKITSQEAFEYYSIGEIFGYIRWEANEYGTQSWRFFVLQACDISTKTYKIAGIKPSAKVLADISGKDRIYKFFNLLDEIESIGIDLFDVAPWYWEQVNARINSSFPPLPYKISQHKAWLLERETLRGSAK